MTVTFGDGVQGARLPTGTVNVTARYRSGIGPDGEVAAATLTMLRAMPLGLRGVTNPVPASRRRRPRAARGCAPQCAADGADLRARRLAARLRELRARLSRASARRAATCCGSTARRSVFLTVAGATGGPPGDDVLTNLRPIDRRRERPVAALRRGRLRAALLQPAGRRSRSTRATASPTCRRRYRALLLASFGFDARDLGQSVTAAEVMALIHTVPGVLAVDLDELLALHRRRRRPPTPRSTRCRPSARAATPRRRTSDAGRAAADQPGGRSRWRRWRHEPLLSPSGSTSCCRRSIGCAMPTRASRCAPCWR